MILTRLSLCSLLKMKFCGLRKQCGVLCIDTNCLWLRLIGTLECRKLNNRKVLDASCIYMYINNIQCYTIRYWPILVSKIYNRKFNSLTNSTFLLHLIKRAEISLHRNNSSYPKFTR